MSLKFMTWTLHAPSTSIFTKYKDLAPGEPWHSKNWITINEDAPKSWDYRKRGFLENIEINHEKIYSIGMHDFGVAEDGTIYSMDLGATSYDLKVLNSDETDIEQPVKKSLRYLMHTYPNIKWTIQTLCTSNSTGKRVEPVLDNKNGAQDVMIRQLKKITQLYLSYGFPIKGVEIDFEKTTSRNGNEPGNDGVPDYEKFKKLLVRVKNEVCIPLNQELRVNLFAMTGDFNPAYYGWHDYRTLASGIDKNGNQAIDEFQLMTYDFSWGGSAPGPSTPLWWLENVLKHVKDALPPEKTFIGNAGYGRRWPLSEQRMGVTLDYKQLMLMQNGTYVHNAGKEDPDGRFPFNDQDFLPFAGFNDEESDYQVTYPHVYDFFKSAYATVGEYNGKKNIQRPKDYAVSYSTQQQPVFNEVQTILTEIGNGINTDEPSEIVNVEKAQFTESFEEGIPFTNFSFRPVARGKWAYNPEAQVCQKEVGETGQDGHIDYNFNLPSAGKFRVIALVGFPFYGNDNFSVNINGTNHHIGGDMQDWYPYITNPSWHFYDCGSYDFNTSGNKVIVGPTDGALIGGFIICKSYNGQSSGGKLIFPTSLQKMKKRGKKKADGTSEIIDGQFPKKMILTSELLRRPPRPAIIWEDYFGPHLTTDFTEETNLTDFSYYADATEYFYVAGSGSMHIQSGGKDLCIDRYRRVGFSQGVWNVKKATDDDYAHVYTDQTLKPPYSGQLVLNRKFDSNISCEADVRNVSAGGRLGLRLLAQNVGEVGDSYIFLLDWGEKQIKLIHEKAGIGTTLINKPMSVSLQNMVNDRLTLKAQIINNVLVCYVNDNAYIDDYTLPYQKISGAYGVYVYNAAVKIYRLTIASLDRYEPLEKVSVHLDNEVYHYGEVERTVPYDEFGYLVYTGYPGNLTEAVRAIPSDPNSGGANEVQGREGTIFETEVVPHDWSLDYKNLQLATVNSWLGKKSVVLEMNDPGIWFRTFYVGDSEGYSVAYNSDKIGFIKTSQLVLDYDCKGIALWTLGQEDPQLFSYIDKPSG
ncbi:glycosyl hydrolase family 18 protein [Bacillus wiedmannii]|uniref:glycosyl hydrolase family 18 protein n=1 Tax=Bacillus wiedmannii TaxID=1890302 RepID=UPI000BFD230C|nr:glycosyl hydrolase family 18 protein [Bacillus wiedmannii]PHA62852.1 glycoside hydrolase [Bacillus wiedmannii]